MVEVNKPRVGAGIGVFVLKDNKVLLGKRHEDPVKASSALHGEGTWTMPGGKLDFQESFEEGAKRELFEETSIKLPTLFMIETTDNTQIEVSIQKQQYASGVQPMVYFSIPITSFENGKELYGKPSTNEDNLIYVFDAKNINTLFDLLKIFAMCSRRHNFDIQEILKILLKQL
jgi:8-oxo-dGTP pyrophosphatase MutT (NUDIX family)